MQMIKQIANYGGWKSPISAQKIANGSISLSQVIKDEKDIYWVEGRPSQGGRSVIVRCNSKGVIADAISENHNARTRVHEYGGGSYDVSRGVIYYSNFADQRIYRQDKKEKPVAITPDDSTQRYADIKIDHNSGNLICINESHSLDSLNEPINSIVRISLDSPAGTRPEVLVSGADFYSNARINSSGTKLTWLQWNHPLMPWDGCELWVADFGKEGIQNSRRLAGGNTEAVFQPEWHPKDEDALFYVSDRTGWWNLHSIDTGTENACPEPVLPMEAEFGTPMWVFGMKTYQFSSSETIVCTYTSDSRWHLGHINIKSKKLSRIGLPYTEYSSINCSEGVAAFKAGSPESSPAVISFNISTKEHIKISKPSADIMHLDDISIPSVIEFPTDNNLTAHGFFYPPKNRKYEGLDTSKPPLLVKIHGGPTGATGSSLNESIQYWTTRGIAVMDINYGGSTGYGTVYRRRLDRNWGVVDVADCVNGALHLIKQGKVDKDKVAIDGGSAGGFTTLAALAFSNVFKAGASFYGVTDLEALARDTHKFESKYLDRLIAPYPSDIAIWQERSPINNIDKISAPVILFQGLEDKVVPPNQAETMVQALRNRNMQVAYIAYEGEQHGFRKSFNIKRTLEAELFFYSKIFKFELAEDIKPVDIYNEQKS
jgi:dipeptidyl aminopeptidase/acylaminoacyl peptidase